MIAAGTRVATPAGNLPVEALRAGDEVLALEDGTLVPRKLTFVARLEVDVAHHHNPTRIAPVRLLAGALAEGVPARELLLSPDHAVMLGGVLLQAQALRNGATVAHDTAPRRVTYALLELARHGLVLAEGTPVETWLDTGNRGQFAASRVRGLAPDLAAIPSAAALAIIVAQACAPLRLDIGAIAAAHATVLARARTLGWRLTPDAGFTVLADEAPAPLVQFEHDLWSARLPEGTRALRLISRRFVPGDLNPAVADRRALGVAVRSLRLGLRKVAAGAYGRGWHLSEFEWRWTDGDGRVALRPLPKSTPLEIHTAPGAVPGYWLASE